MLDVDFVARISQLSASMRNCKHELLYSYVSLHILELSKYCNGKHNRAYSSSDISNKIRRYFDKNGIKMDKCYGQNSEKYWLYRGWSVYEARVKVKEFTSKRKKQHSPFSYKKYLELGFDLETAKYEANKRRPIRKEYWLELGYDEAVAEDKAKEAKNKNNIKGSKNNKARSVLDFKHSSKRCIEYWIDRGYSEKESKKLVGDIQNTFNLEKCISIHGEDAGMIIWQDRQDRWNKTMKNHIEYDRIQRDKNIYSYERLLRKYGKHDDVVSHLKRLAAKNGIKLFNSAEDLDAHLDSFFRAYGLSDDNLFKQTTQVSFNVLGIIDIKSYIFDNFGKYDISKGYIPAATKMKYGTRIYDVDSQGDFVVYLSKWEYDFSNMLKTHNIKFYANRNYPNSNMMYDFFLTDFNLYIEICGMYFIEGYSEKIDIKRKTFGCVVLNSPKEFMPFVESIV